MPENVINRAADALSAYATLLRHLVKYGVGEAQPLADDADRIAAELKVTHDQRS